MREIFSAVRFTAVLGIVCAGIACGSNSTTPMAPSGPSASASPQPAASPTLAAGPVAAVSIVVRTVNNGERDPGQGTDGKWMVAPGERVDFDATQTNAAGGVCQWRGDPIWYVDGVVMPLESSNGIVLRRGSTQPFLLKLTMENQGTFAVQAEVDGVRSNTLQLRSSN
jgi:hypothetical protein